MFKTNILEIGLMAVIFVTGIGQADTMLKTFNFKNVRLTDSRLKVQFDQVKQEYLGIPNDNLLRGFRLRTGRPAPGEDLKGWYADDFFNAFPQIVSGLARMYAAGGDEACLKKVNYLINEWALCLEDDGYFLYSRKSNAPHYYYDKMVGCLVDAYLYCGNTEALTYMNKITDWAIVNLDQRRIYADEAVTNPEWYTISENIYRAYLVTGDVKYRKFAEIWEYTEYWKIFAAGGDIFDRHTDYHAYSHVNALGGAGTAYEVKGETWYLDALVNAHDYLRREQTYATGGFGPAELFLRRDNLIASLQKTENHFETQCGSWAIFKLVKYLLRFTGDARFGDWAELMTFNGIGASVGMDPRDGTVQYYSDYSLNGGRKSLRGFWTCCCATRPEAVADYCDLTWFHDDDGLYVNLYTPSTVEWPHGGATVKVAQNGELHHGHTIRFTVSLPKPQMFAIKLRAPEWLAEPMTIMVNDKAVKAVVDARHWLAVEREWKDGDVMQVMLPMELRAKSLDPQRAEPAAIVYGPIVLVGDLEDREQAKIDYRHPKKELAAGKNAHFTWIKDESVELRPFFEYKKDEPYFMYFDDDAANVKPVKYVGDWKRLHIYFQYSNEKDAYAECEFKGDTVTWTGYSFDDGGIADVYVDDILVGQADQWSAKRSVPFSWTYTGAGTGWHCLRIVVSGKKREESFGTFQNITSIVAHGESRDTD